MGKKKRLYIAYTGGTLGMRQSEHGYVPDDDLRELIDALLPPILAAELPDFELVEHPPLIDSANAVPTDWQRLGQIVANAYEQYDGFVILHGTDTMAYAASALSFMLRGLDKPVIVTGSQIPLREMRNDARNNLVTALILAANDQLKEVCLYFNGRLMRGNRSTKAKADELDAFDSPNYPYLGEVGIKIDIHHGALLNHTVPASPRFELAPYHNDAVTVIKLYPGISARILQALLAEPTRAAVLECYGVGNAPDACPALLQALKQAHERGVVIVSVSQCLEGSIDSSGYATGAKLAEQGVIAGFDLTTEAAFTKLHHLLSLGLSPETIRQRLPQALAGELST